MNKIILSFLMLFSYVGVYAGPLMHQMPQNDFPSPSPMYQQEVEQSQVMSGQRVGPQSGIATEQGGMIQTQPMLPGGGYYQNQNEGQVYIPYGPTVQMGGDDDGGYGGGEGGGYGGDDD